MISKKGNYNPGCIPCKTYTKGTPSPKLCVPGIFREREAVKKLKSYGFKKRAVFWPKFLVSYQKKLLKDQGQLHIHAKVGRVSNAVTPRTDFTKEMTPLLRQKVRSTPKILGISAWNAPWIKTSYA